MGKWENGQFGGEVGNGKKVGFICGIFSGSHEL